MASERRNGRHGLRVTALGLAVMLLSPILTGCGRDTGAYDSSQPVERTGGSRSEYPSSTERKPGLSRGQKIAILTGAAALYYLYNKHKSQQGRGQEGQYYLSKNGRVYYRDRNGNPVWVTPPPQGIEVPESEAAAYDRYRGYNGRSSGETFGGYGATNQPMVPGPSGL